MVDTKLRTILLVVAGITIGGAVMLIFVLWFIMAMLDGWMGT